MPIGCAMKIKLKKNLPRGPPNLFSGSEEQRDCCSISSYSNLKSKGDDVIPIDSHVTSEEEKRKLYLPYFHISNILDISPLSFLQRLIAIFNFFFAPETV